MFAERRGNVSPRWGLNRSAWHGDCLLNDAQLFRDASGAADDTSITQFYRSMNAIKSVLTLAACVAVFAAAAPTVRAQGFQPPSQEEIRAQMLDKVRDRLEIKDDAEWSAIKPKVNKTMDAAQEVLRMRDLSSILPDFGNFRRRDNSGDNTNNNADRPRRRRGGMGMFGGDPTPSVAALEKALEDKAPKEEIKTKLAAVRAELKDKEAKLAAAREDLRSVLTAKQEAALVVNGILD